MALFAVLFGARAEAADSLQKDSDAGGISKEVKKREIAGRHSSAVKSESNSASRQGACM